MTSRSDYRLDRVSEPGGQESRLTWLRPRLVIILVVVLVGIILAVVAGGRFLGSQDQVAVAAQNDLLSTGAYQFTGQGKIVGGSGATWVIGGVPILVSDQTQVEDGIHPGDSVSVLGHITSDGKWLAERINLIPEQESFFSFGGPLEARSQTAWKVAGISIAVNDKTQLGSALQDNELVLVTFKAQADGTWLGLEIVSLSGQATPTPASASSNSSANNKQTGSNQTPSSLQQSGKKDSVPGCYKSNGKNKGKRGNGYNPCQPAHGNNNQGNGNEGDD